MATQVYVSEHTGAQIDAAVNRAESLTTSATASLGSATKPIYLASGVLTASGSTVGGAAKPMYLASGTMTACSSTVGGAASSGTMTPVYMNAGTVTSCGATTYTAAQVDTLLAAKAASSHTHDDRYYTESEVNSLLANKISDSFGSDPTQTTTNSYDIKLGSYINVVGKYRVSNAALTLQLPASGNYILFAGGYGNGMWTGVGVYAFGWLSGYTGQLTTIHAVSGLTLTCSTTGLMTATWTSAAPHCLVAVRLTDTGKN